MDQNLPFPGFLSTPRALALTPTYESWLAGKCHQVTLSSEQWFSGSYICCLLLDYKTILSSLTDGSVITVQEAQTQTPCRLQFLWAAIMFSTDKTAMRTDIAAAGPALEQMDPEASGRASGSVQLALNQVGLYVLFM